MARKSEKELEYPLFLFHQGNNARAYEFLGSHRTGKDEVTFRVWAPNAVTVGVAGDFNGWKADEAKCRRINDQGVWEAVVKGVKEYDAYKYRITAKDGRILMKSDPYGYHMETRPDNATKFYELDGFSWTDDAWMKRRTEQVIYHSPVNIYEVHAGSWRKYADDNFFSYRDLADELVAFTQCGTLVIDDEIRRIDHQRIGKGIGTGRKLRRKGKGPAPFGVGADILPRKTVGVDGYEVRVSGDDVLSVRRVDDAVGARCGVPEELVALGADDLVHVPPERLLPGPVHPDDGVRRVVYDYDVIYGVEDHVHELLCVDFRLFHCFPHDRNRPSYALKQRGCGRVL